MIFEELQMKNKMFPKLKWNSVGKWWKCHTIFKGHLLFRTTKADVVSPWFVFIIFLSYYVMPNFCEISPEIWFIHYHAQFPFLHHIWNFHPNSRVAHKQGLFLKTVVTRKHNGSSKHRPIHDRWKLQLSHLAEILIFGKSFYSFSIVENIGNPLVLASLDLKCCVKFKFATVVKKGIHL